jgi:hypothetical protein
MPGISRLWFAPTQVVVATITQEADGMRGKSMRRFLAGLQGRDRLPQREDQLQGPRAFAGQGAGDPGGAAMREAEEQTVNVRRLGRPFRVLINNDLMKIPEIAPFALPISFDETREAMAINMATRQQAVELLKAGVTIVVFPAGGVATAPKGFGRAVDLPWKMFPARLVQAAGHR